MDKPERKCDVCGKPIPPSVSGSRPAKRCSPECRRVARREYSRKYMRGFRDLSPMGDLRGERDSYCLALAAIIDIALERGPAEADLMRMVQVARKALQGEATNGPQS